MTTAPFELFPPSETYPGAHITFDDGRLTIIGWSGTLRVHERALPVHTRAHTTALFPGDYRVFPNGLIVHEPPALPERHEPVPILAAKAALLNLGGLFPFWFKATTQPIDYPVDAEAICIHGSVGRNPLHGSVPSPVCSCGFYAVRLPHHQRIWAGPLVRAAPQRPVRLAVELSGKVIVADNGYRAQHQRVLTVTTVDRCHDCSRPATWLGQERSYCDRCHGRKVDGVHLDQIAERIGIPVTAGS